MRVLDFPRIARLFEQSAPKDALRIRALPGVWRPHSDARMLAQLVAERALATGADVLDVFTGSGVLALAAATGGARSVTAIDISRRALVSVRLNARRNGVEVRTLRGDLFAPVAGERFDLILANPPYFPGADTLPTHGAARAWEGGRDGRVLVDRLCAEAPRHLRPSGTLLVVHNSMIGEPQTRERLEAGGLRTEVLLRHRGRLGSVGRATVARLREPGLIDGPGSDGFEEILVMSATMPRSSGQPIANP
jgi:release factor glutamine methyltransferase